MRELYGQASKVAAHLRDRALPQTCYFCGDSGAETVCPPCAQALPKLAAETCPCCQLPSANGQRCGRCLKKPPAWTTLAAQWAYDFPLDAALLSAKYHHAFAIYRWAAAQWLQREQREQGEHGERQARHAQWPFAADATLVPVPLAPLREQERGFNQALLIATEFAGAFDLRVDAGAAVRIRETGTQQRLNWVERRRNVRGAFAATRSLAGESIVLVDDVLTTGATLNELARTLLAAGAAEVNALVLARVQPIRRRDRVVKFGRTTA